MIRNNNFQYSLSLMACSLIVVSLFGCSVATLRVESIPENAEVYVNVQGQSSRKIGQTPLNLNESTLGIGDQSFQLSVIKDGFQTENVLVPPTSFSRSTVVQMRLKEITSANKAMNEQTVQRVASTVASVQSLLKAREYDQAEKSLTSILSQFPGVSTLHELLGNVYYLRRDLTGALSSYKKANELNPGNPDTQRMINKIEGIRGDRSPSSGGTQ